LVSCAGVMQGEPGENLDVTFHSLNILGTIDNLLMLHPNQCKELVLPIRGNCVVFPLPLGEG